jgi:hypothetical protein
MKIHRAAVLFMCLLFWAPALFGQETQSKSAQNGLLEPERDLRLGHRAQALISGLALFDEADLMGRGIQLAQSPSDTPDPIPGRTDLTGSVALPNGEFQPGIMVFLEKNDFGFGPLMDGVLDSVLQKPGLKKVEKNAAIGPGHKE